MYETKNEETKGKPMFILILRKYFLCNIIVFFFIAFTKYMLVLETRVVNE